MLEETVGFLHTDWAAACERHGASHGNDKEPCIPEARETAMRVARRTKGDCQAAV